ncbi:hypothetical protein DL771_006902 [Monosporascus sp. 5C6A]|nr:hypothetical protein DL771_006902 [Monosporascus sp. 5C6A]
MRSSLLLLSGYFGAFLAEAKPSFPPSNYLSPPLSPLLSRRPMSGHLMRRDVNPNQPEYYGPSQTALLFLDYQNVLINMITDQGERSNLINSAKQLLATARKNRVAIIHCLIDTDINPPRTSKIYEQWFTINKPALEAMPELAEEYSEFAPTCNSTSRYETISWRLPGPRSAFVNKDLLPLLRNELGVTSLILGGIATSGAVMGTALQGMDEDFVVTVVEDAVWDPNPQIHRDLLDVVFPVLGYVVSTAEAVGYMEKK